MYCYVNLIGRTGKFLATPRAEGGNVFTYVDKTGKTQEAVSFTVYLADKKIKNSEDDSRFSVTAYGFMAKRCIEMLNTGDLVHINGSLSVKEYGPAEAKKTSVNITIGNSFGDISVLKPVNIIPQVPQAPQAQVQQVPVQQVNQQAPSGGFLPATDAENAVFEIG